MNRKRTYRKCYQCDSDGVTKEHIPAKSFFPDNHRKNLITVPSCHDHNTSNSEDVEYVRNLITSHINANDVGMSHFQDKVIRSFDNSPKLFHRSFRDASTVLLSSEESLTYRFEFRRLAKVMSDLAYGLYFRDFRKSFMGTWGIFSLSLLSPATVFEGKPDGWERYRETLRQLTFQQKSTPQPRVFQYGVVQWNELQLIYRLIFYEGFVVDALSLRPAPA
jgi:hypothetical protein